MEYQNTTVRLIMKYKKLVLILIGNLVALFIILSESQAQVSDTRGYIYGKVVTLDNDYQGHIRWGTEETFWHDYFNAEKIADNQYEDLFEKYKRKSDTWEDFDWDFSSIWEDKFSNISSHRFDTQFGNLKSIRIISRSRIEIELKNGNRMRLNGDGYNDVGSSIRIMDDEIGEVSIKWDRIEKIEFLPSPRNLRLEERDPIYGKVETYRKGTFEGFIEWDRDEKFLHEKLDGDNRDGDVSIPFGEIEYIEKQGDGCQVILRSGREYYLDNSNDVDRSNRGLIMAIPKVGNVEIPWKYFRSASFRMVSDSGPSYDEYKVPRGLFGSVYTIDGDDFSGKIIYDLDESWELECLDGQDDEVEYSIPFQNIKSIIPKNYAYSMVELRNGDKLLLGEVRDVSDSNDGILIFVERGEDPQYIPWEKVAEIVFD